MSSLAAKGVEFSYGRRPVLAGFDLEIPSGSMVGIVGPNGAGKSTALKLFCGLLSPAAGTIELDDKDIRGISRRGIARRVAMIPQQINTRYQFTLGQVVLMGRHPHRGLAMFETAEDLAVADLAMRECGVTAMADRPMPSLSGGEQQRGLVAAALAQQPSVLLADEPTSSLDLRFQVEIYTILERMNRRDGVTVVAVTHDLNLASMFCRRIVVLAAGRVLADGAPSAVLRPDLLKEAYSSAVHVGTRPDAELPYVLPARREDGR